MSKVELIRCDACGLIQGEDGRAEKMWANVRLPDTHPLDTPLPWITKHYCLNCWSEIEKSIPEHPKRPAAPVKK